MDRLFDVFNSRSPISKGFKAPLRHGNWESTRRFLLEAKNFLLSLRNSDGTLLSKTRRSDINFILIASIQTLFIN